MATANPEAFSESDQLLTTSETSEFIKLSEGRIRQLARSGNIPCFRKGKLLFSRNQLISWLQENGNIKTA